MTQLRFALAFSLLLTGCPPSGEAATVLKVQGNVRDASVTIDDVYVGALAYVAARGVVLPRGKHRVTIEKAGYFPVDKIVESSGEAIVLKVELVKIPD